MRAISKDKDDLGGNSVKEKAWFGRCGEGDGITRNGISKISHLVLNLELYLFESETKYMKKHDLSTRPLHFHTVKMCYFTNEN